MTRTALITGASGGIGLELARIHASKGDNLILIARSEPQLSTLKSELESTYGVQVTLMIIDLSQDGAAEAVYRDVQQSGRQIDYLINNAGFGIYGFFTETDLKRQEKMIRLNILSLTQLTWLFVRNMAERGEGRVMNVASTAAFQPGPKMATYYASKAYVLHFSEALDNEVRSRGVTVTALCPGPTESGFQSAAGLEKVFLFEKRRLPDSREVAEYGYRAMMRGKRVAIHGLLNKILNKLVRVTPRLWVVKIVRLLKMRVN